MKTKFENSRVAKYFLRNPFLTVAALTLVLTSLIAVDQCLYGIAASDIDRAVINHFHSLNGTYVGWSSTNPEIIAYFKGAHEPSAEDFTPSSLVTYKTAAQNFLNFIEAQAKFAKNVLNYFFAS